MNKTQLRNKLRNLFNNIIIDERTLFAAVIESEVVIGRFVVEGYDEEYSGIAFRSSICPEFIKKENRRNGDTEETGMTGFFGCVNEFTSCNGRVFISFDEGVTLSLVEPVRLFERYIYESDDNETK